MTADSIEAKRSAVRRRVTYWGAGIVFFVFGFTVIWSLVAYDKPDLETVKWAGGILVALVGPVIGFWFGGRGAAGTPSGE